MNFLSADLNPASVRATEAAASPAGRVRWNPAGLVSGMIRRTGFRAFDRRQDGNAGKQPTLE